MRGSVQAAAPATCEKGAPVAPGSVREAGLVAPSSSQGSARSTPLAVGGFFATAAFERHGLLIARAQKKAISQFEIRVRS
jgi:hypothetical protein